MKLARLVALGAAAALALTACSDGGSTPEENSLPAGNSAGDNAHIGGAVTVWLAGDDTPDAAINWLKEEAKGQHSIDVNVEKIGWGDLLPRVQTAIGADGQSPDIVELGNTQVQAFTNAGAFADVTDLWEDLGGENLSLGGFAEGGSVGDAVMEASVASAANGRVTPASQNWAGFEGSERMEELFFEIAKGGNVTDIAAKYDAIITDALNKN